MDRALLTAAMKEMSTVRSDEVDIVQTDDRTDEKSGPDEAMVAWIRCVVEDMASQSWLTVAEHRRLKRAARIHRLKSWIKRVLHCSSPSDGGRP